MSVTPTSSRSNLYYWAQRRKNPNPEPSAPQDKRSQAQTPMSEIRYDFSNPPYIPSDPISIAPNNPTREQKIGNSFYGSYVKSANGELAWESTKDIYVLYGLDGLDEYLADENGKIDTNAQAVLDTVKALVPEKKAIKDLINRLAEKAGISSGDLAKLKIEVDDSGKVLVGGLADTKMTKKLQEALNEETGFAARLRSYQRREESLYANVISSGIFDMFRMGAGGEVDAVGMDLLEEMVAEQGIENLDGIGASTLAYACAELFRDNTVSADFSHKAKGLADPGATIHSELGKIENTISKELENINLQNRMASTNRTQALEDVVSMDNVKITLTENGEIKIEGSFSQSGAADSEARAKAVEILQKELFGQTDNGGESALLTAMRQLRLDHDEKFGDSGYAKTGSVTFDGKKSETFVDSPEAKLALQNEMTDAVVQAVKDETGVSLEAGAITVNEEGKIIASELPPSADAKKIHAFIDSINAIMEQESDVISEEEQLARENDGSIIKETADTLKGLLEEFVSYEQRKTRYFFFG